MTAVAERLRPIMREARPYPAYLLQPGDEGLALFSAAFHGWNDVIHLARKGVVTTCVDTNLEKLHEMRKIYPSGWSFVCDDAFAFAAAQDEQSWDVVTVDPFLGDAAQKVWRNLDLFLRLSRRVVTVTVLNTYMGTQPDGWRQMLFPRSPRVSWLVLQRD